MREHSVGAWFKKETALQCTYWAEFMLCSSITLPVIIHAWLHHVYIHSCKCQTEQPCFNIIVCFQCYILL